MADVVVIGAGFGGLSSAITLGAAGHRVTVLEAAADFGGKAGTQTVDGVRFDTGPSVLTLPHVIDELLQITGRRLDDVLTLRRPDPAFRYRFDDGIHVDVHHEPEATLASVKHALGSDAAADLRAFLAYTRRVWEAAGPNFVYGDAPSLWGVAKLGPWRWLELTAVDPWRTMWSAIRAKVRSPHLAAILARYATYNGSDPRKAPATLNCIAHVELGLGGYGVDGGLGAVVEALVDAAEAVGVTFRTGARVARIEVTHRRARGVQLASGERIGAEAVVANADAAHLFGELLDPSPPLDQAEAPSMSGYTAVFRARPADARAAHTVLMATPYLNEFIDVFEQDRPPSQPTVYLCDQALAHGANRWPDGAHPVFVMANAPAEPLAGPRPDHLWTELRERMRVRAHADAALDPGDRLVWERTPAGLAERFPGSRGALYGAASNGMWSAFRRPANRVPRIEGLFLASGSAHPGGGVPLAILSGRAAARQLQAWGPQ